MEFEIDRARNSGISCYIDLSHCSITEFTREYRQSINIIPDRGSWSHEDESYEFEHELDVIRDDARDMPRLSASSLTCQKHDSTSYHDRGDWLSLADSTTQK